MEKEQLSEALDVKLINGKCHPRPRMEEKERLNCFPRARMIKGAVVRCRRSYRVSSFTLSCTLHRESDFCKFPGNISNSRYIIKAYIPISYFYCQVEKVVIQYHHCSHCLHYRDCSREHTGVVASMRMKRSSISMLIYRFLWH